MCSPSTCPVVRHDARSGTPSFTGMTKEEQETLDLARAAADAAIANAEQAKQDAQDATDLAAKAVADAKAKDATIAKLTAANDLLKLQQNRETQDAAKRASATELQKQVDETIAVRADARRILGYTPKDPTGASWKHDGKSNDQLKREIVKQLEPDFAVKVDALESAALEAVYEIALKNHARSDAAQEQALAAAAGPRHDADSGADDDAPSAADARKAMEKKRLDAWKKTPSRMDRKRMTDSSKGGMR